MDYKMADKVISATMSNIIIESPKDIYLEWFNYKDPTHLYFLEIARIVSSIRNKKIYVDLTPLNFLKFKLTYFRKYKRVKRWKASQSTESSLRVPFYLEYMKKAFNINMKFYQEIYERYYGGKKKW